MKEYQFYHFQLSFIYDNSDNLYCSELGQIIMMFYLDEIYRGIGQGLDVVAIKNIINQTIFNWLKYENS